MSDGRVQHLRGVARKEFGRRGFEATTMRDIAAAAGLSTGTVYRSFKSKDQLLLSIMRSYTERVKSAWEAVLSTRSSPLENLDGLMWANVHVMDRFSEEFRIQLAWLRQSPPNTPNLGLSFAWHLRQIKALLSEGETTESLRVEGRTAISGPAACRRRSSSPRASCVPPGPERRKPWPGTPCCVAPSPVDEPGVADAMRRSSHADQRRGALTLLAAADQASWLRASLRRVSPGYGAIDCLHPRSPGVPSRWLPEYRTKRRGPTVRLSSSLPTPRSTSG